MYAIHKIPMYAIHSQKLGVRGLAGGKNKNILDQLRTKHPILIIGFENFYYI